MLTSVLSLWDLVHIVQELDRVSMALVSWLEVAERGLKATKTIT